jgi:uncharacterized protein YbcI
VSKADIDGETLAAISRDVVRLEAQSDGKGATEAKTYMCDNFLFCVLKGGLTPVERTLLDHQDEEVVRDFRQHYQNRMADTYKAVVRRETGREVLTYQSQMLFNPDYTIEIFYLADPGGGEGDLDERDLDRIVDE